MTVNVLLIGVLSVGLLRADTGEAAVKQWLGTNRGVDTLKVEFTQTRKLTSLKSVIRQRGVLWVDRRGEGSFRWQTGDPPGTIVTRKGGQLLIVRPRSRQYERRPAGESGSSMAILAEGFPRSWEEFQRKYHLVGVKSRGEVHRINVQPRGQLDRGIQILTFVTGGARGVLQALEVKFRDGSSQQIVFDKVERRLPLRAELFSPDLSGYQATKFK
ncbi:MAG: outer membrane lipoprotein carrier protein LolA [Verrucomicrobiota bacterium]|nr:outer membrane lipoprotein carrier protein LolA [Verrucomicrobiota bacterium]